MKKSICKLFLCVLLISTMLTMTLCGCSGKWKYLQYETNMNEYIERVSCDFTYYKGSSDIADTYDWRIKHDYPVYKAVEFYYQRGRIDVYETGFEPATYTEIAFYTKNKKIRGIKFDVISERVGTEEQEDWSSFDLVVLGEFDVIINKNTGQKATQWVDYRQHFSIPRIGRYEGKEMMVMFDNPCNAVYIKYANLEGEYYNIYDKWSIQNVRFVYSD